MLVVIRPLIADLHGRQNLVTLDAIMFTPRIKTRKYKDPNKKAQVVARCCPLGSCFVDTLSC